MGLRDIDDERIDPEYDREFNLLYIKVNPTLKTGIVKSKRHIDENILSNLAIYDIEKDNLIHFFEKEEQKTIMAYLYETSYNEKLEKMTFNRSSHNIFNNDKIPKREKSDKLFVITKKPGGEECEMWVSSRLGHDKKLIQTFPKNLDWKIDVFNKKVLFIYKLENEIRVESIDW